jgi:ketosteroid isomerase-like protein
METVEKALEDLGSRWVEAEQAGDVVALEAMTTDGFRLVGPAGFVLNKKEWLERYRSGALVTQDLSLEQVSIREYGATAVAIGVQAQRATYGGHCADGLFRTTHIAVRSGQRWLLAGQHLSPLRDPGGAR